MNWPITKRILLFQPPWLAKPDRMWFTCLKHVYAYNLEFYHDVDLAIFPHRYARCNYTCVSTKSSYARAIPQFDLYRLSTFLTLNLLEKKITNVFLRETWVKVAQYKLHFYVKKTIPLILNYLVTRIAHFLWSDNISHFTFHDESVIARWGRKLPSWGVVNCR